MFSKYVFSWDRSRLWPLNETSFQQMMGRAGRRGFDDLGHVVFFGNPSYEVHTARTVGLPNLATHSHLPLSLVLRMLLFYQDAKIRVAKNFVHFSTVRGCGFRLGV